MARKSGVVLMIFTRYLRHITLSHVLFKVRELNLSYIKAGRALPRQNVTHFSSLIFPDVCVSIWL